MHNIRYTYPNGNNRLGSITSTGIASSAYQYDALGNLVRDNAEGLAVEWNAMGKVDSICRNGNLLSRFRYSPTGQRQVKVADGDTVFYIHDATGNVICVYLLKNDTLSVTERYMYGSKRLGMLGQQVWIVAGGTAGMSDSSTIGARTYELTDHLGNVTATILDRKRPVLNSYGNMVYIPLIVSYTDYYPFGYPISDRSYYNGGYRYFFNGQEADNEVLGEGVLHAFEYRMHDTRIGRFWSVDPLAGKFPWNSVYAFAENSPIGFLELEGLEKVQFGIDVVNFTGKTKEEVKALLRKYKQYHRGNLSVKEIMSSANDKETWEVLDMTDVNLNSTGTKVKKITKNGVFEEVRRSGFQRLYHWDECLEGRSDGANQGTMTTKDLVVGFGFFCAITSLGALVEAGASAEVIIGLVNSIDDAFGVFTNGSGSLSQDLTPEQAKVVTNSVKTILSAITTATGHYNLKKKGAKTEPETKIKTKKALDYLNSILNFLDLTSKTYGTVKDEKDKNDAKKQKAKQE